MDWPIVPLHHVAEQVRRPEVPQLGTTYRQIGVRLWGEGAYQRETIDGSETKYSVLYRVQAGDIVVNKIWARNGSVSVITDDLSGSYGSPEFPTYSIDKSSLLPEWFAWYSKTKGLWTQCDVLSRGTSGQNRLRPDRFLEVRLPIPPLDEQRRIVARLDRVAELIQERRDAIATADSDLQSLLSKAFEHAIAGAPRYPMEEVAPLIRRPVGGIDLDKSYPELGVRSFGRGTFHKPALLGIQVGTKKLFRIEPGDLVFNNVFAWEGAVAIVPSGEKGRVGSHRFLTCVTVPETVTAGFLLFYFLTREGLQQLGEASPGGAGRNRTLGLRKLAAIEVPVPPIGTQRWFDRLQDKAGQIRRIRSETFVAIDTLSTAVLREVFGGERNANP